MKIKKLLAIVLTVALLAMTLVVPAFAGTASMTASTLSGGKATFTLKLAGGIASAEGKFTVSGGTIDSISSDVSISADKSSGTFAAAGSSRDSITITVVCSSTGSSVTLAYNLDYVGDGNGDDTTVSPTSGSATAKAATTAPTTKPTTKPTAKPTAKPTTTKPTTTKPTTTASTAADLKSLSVDGYSISPKFSQGRTSYNLEVPADFAGKLNVKAVPLDSAAKVTITGNDITDGKGAIKITVKGTDGTTKTYRITVAPPAETTTEAPTVAEGLKLSTLKVGAGLALDFQPDVLEYTVKVPAGTKSLDVEALIGEIEGATVRVEGADDLAASNNVVKVIVTDANGVETVYTINVVEETPLAQAPATQDDGEKKSGGMPIWLAIMLILLAFILGLVIGFLLGKKKAENDYYDDDDDDDAIFGGSADDDEPISSPYGGGMNFNPPSVGGSSADFSLPYEAAAPVVQDTAPTATPIASADSFIQSAD